MLFTVPVIYHNHLRLSVTSSALWMFCKTVITVIIIIPLNLFTKCCYHWWWWSINKRIGRTMGKKGRNVVCQLSAAANGLAQGGWKDGRIPFLCAHILCGWRTVISCNSSRAFGSGVKGRSEGKSERDTLFIFIICNTNSVFRERNKSQGRC